LAACSYRFGVLTLPAAIPLSCPALLGVSLRFKNPWSVCWRFFRSSQVLPEATVNPPPSEYTHHSSMFRPLSLRPCRSPEFMFCKHFPFYDRLVPPVYASFINSCLLFFLRNLALSPPPHQFSIFPLGVFWAFIIDGRDSSAFQVLFGFHF